jgi:hypothetical protein
MFQQQLFLLLAVIVSSSISFVDSSLFGSASSGGVRGRITAEADTPTIPSTTKIIIDSTLYQDDDARLITYTCIEDTVDTEITCDWYIMVPMYEEEDEEINTYYQISYTTSILEDARSIIDSTLFVEDNDDTENRLVSYTCLSSSSNIDKNFYDGGIMCDWFIMVPMLKDYEDEELPMEEDQ